MPSTPSTKICIIRNCEYFQGTRLPIRMFRIPKNEHDLENWEKAIGTNAVHPLRGMICINHFCESDLKLATKTKPVGLKQGAIPQVFPFSNKEKATTTDVGPENAHSAKSAIHLSANIVCITDNEDISQRNGCCNEICNHQQIQYEELRKDCVIQKINRDSDVLKLENRIIQLKAIISNQSNNIKSLNKRLSNALKANDKLKNDLQISKDQTAICDEAMKCWQKVNADAVLSCIVNGVKPGQKYHENVRKFSFEVAYHRLAAYEVVRKQFENHLPHPKTLKKWLALSDLSGEAGLNEDTLNRLKGFVNDLEGKPLICALIFDEIYIRQQVYWDENKMDYVGFITYGKETPPKKKDKEQEENWDDPDVIPIGPIAKKALNFMLSGINFQFQFPVAYHFVDSLESMELSTLLSEIIVKVSQCGVKIGMLTFDGDKKNIAMCKILGANLDVFSSDFRPYIESPFDGNVIYLIFDPSHAEKLMRNLLGNHKVLFDDSKNKIEWKYFVELVNLSKTQDINIHKMNRKHIEFSQNKMNVRLAAETFSRSVGDSMGILKNKNNAGFKDCGPTIRFTYLMNTLFDIFNTRNRRNENIYKCALNSDNKQAVFSFIEECTNYLKSLKIEVVRKVKGHDVKKLVNVAKTIYGTAVLGFLMDLTNLPLIYAQYVENDRILTQINTYSFSQDHIEIFHAKIRSRNGHNSNPNVAQYKGAYRRLQCKLDIKAPESANCMTLDPIDSELVTPQSNVYFVSSRRPKLDIMSDVTFQRNLECQRDEILEEFGEIEEFNELEGIDMSNHIIDGIAGASIAYAARMIEKKIETQTFYCDCCKFVFSQNNKLDDRSIYIIESKRPCASTFYICKTVDRFLKLYKPKHFRLDSADNNLIDNQIRDFRVIFYMIFNEINFDAIFTKSDFKNHEEHKFHLVKCIVQEYIRIKTVYISKQMTLSQYDTILRTKLTRWIHFCGQ